MQILLQCKLKMIMTDGWESAGGAFAEQPRRRDVLQRSEE